MYTDTSLIENYRRLFITSLQKLWDKVFELQDHRLYTRYPIVARHTVLGLPAAFRPNASREQRYLAYKTIVVPQTKLLWFLGNWKKSTIITGRDGKFPRVDSGVVCKIPLLARALGLNVEQVKRVRDERVSCIQTLVPNFDLLNVCHIKISLLNKNK